MRNEPPFTGRLLEAIKTSGSSRSFVRGDFILKQGDIEKNLYYVSSGAIRVFLLSEHEEQTIRFGYEGSLINSLSSYISGEPSGFYIEAIRKTTLKVISREETLKLVYQDEHTLQARNAAHIMLSGHS